MESLPDTEEPPPPQNRVESSLFYYVLWISSVRLAASWTDTLVSWRDKITILDTHLCNNPGIPSILPKAHHRQYRLRWHSNLGPLTWQSFLLPHWVRWSFLYLGGSQDTKEATRKRIESLKASKGADAPAGRARSSPLKGGRAAGGGGDGEVRGPKRLSQVKVDPSIAKSLGMPARAASAGQPKTADTAAAPILDLFGDSQPQVSAPPAAPPSATVIPGSLFYVFSQL
jgi:hypothetical protein